MTKQQAIFWYDLETTGFDSEKNAIHQLAGIFEIDDKVVKKINIKMNAAEGKEVTEGAFTFFLTQEEKDALAARGEKASDKIKSYQSAEDGFAELKAAFEEFKGTKFTLAGFNNKWFDNKFLRQLFIDNDAAAFAKEYFNGENLDVLVEYKEFIGGYTRLSQYNKPLEPWKIPEEYRTENIKLETLAKHFNVEINAHDGLSDIEATRKIYYIVFRKGEEMHDLEYRDDHQQYHEQVVLKEELEVIDAEIEQEFIEPTTEEKPTLSDIGMIEPTLALTVKTIGEVELHENANDFAEHIGKFLEQIDSDKMVVDADFEIGNNLVKVIKKQREHIKIAKMSLDNASIAEIRSILDGVDTMLQKKQSSFEKAIKDYKANKKEEFYKKAFEELTDSDKFGIEYDKFHDLLAARVKGKRSEESMNKEAELLITELNTQILEKTQRYLEINKVVKETFSFNVEECTDNMIDKYSDEYLEKCYDDETIKLFLEKEINALKKTRQDKLKAEINAESTAASKAHAMDHKTPTFVFNVSARVVIKASCASEAKFMLEKDLVKINGRVDTLEVTEE